MIWKLFDSKKFLLDVKRHEMIHTGNLMTFFNNNNNNNYNAFLKKCNYRREKI